MKEEDKMIIEHISTSMYGVDFTDEQCKVVFRLIDEAKKEVFDDIEKFLEADGLTITFSGFGPTYFFGSSQ